MTMVKWLIIANLVAFVPVTILRIAHQPPWEVKFFALSWEGLSHWFVWQPLTHIFLHFEPWSLVFSVLVLWFLGRDLEYHMGPMALMKLYALAALAGAMGYLPLSALLNDSSPFFGSESAFLAILVAYATLWPDRPIMFDVTAKWWAIIFTGATSWYMVVTWGPVFLGHLGGVAAGYLFVKVAGYSPSPAWLEKIESFFRRFRRNKPEPQYPTFKVPKPLPPEDMDTEEYISKEVDPILDKISREGMQSLTAREKRILERARQKMDKKS